MRGLGSPEGEEEFAAIKCQRQRRANFNIPVSDRDR